MDQLKLLRDYVTTMEREVQSKNAEIRTLTQQNQRLLQQNRHFLSLQMEKQKLSNSLNNSVRVISASCTECVKLKRMNEQLRVKYDQMRKKIQSCGQQENLKQQIRQKDELITNMRTQLSAFTTKILSLQTQLTSLNPPKPIVLTQAVSRQSDLQRISYLNNQLQQYMALVNSLRSEIKQLSQQNYQLVMKIRQLENMPKEIQIIEKQISKEIVDQIKGFKIEIGELSNDNILLRRQNAALKRQIMNLQLIKTQPYIDINEHSKPRSSSFITNNINDLQRRGKHFKKQQQQQQQISPSLLYQQQRVKYDDYSRKLQMLQMENDYLRGTLYSEI